MAQESAVIATPEIAVNQLEADEKRWLLAAGLPCSLTVELPVPHFRLGDALKLATGNLAATAHHLSQDLPLRINGTLIGWGEFELLGEKLAIRITQLA